MGRDSEVIVSAGACRCADEADRASLFPRVLQRTTHRARCPDVARGRWAYGTMRRRMQRDAKGASIMPGRRHLLAAAGRTCGRGRLRNHGGRLRAGRRAGRPVRRQVRADDHRLRSGRRLRPVGPGRRAAHRPLSAGQPERRAAEHAGCRQLYGDQLHLQRGAEGRLGAWHHCARRRAWAAERCARRAVRRHAAVVDRYAHQGDQCLHRVSYREGEVVG